MLRIPKVNADVWAGMAVFLLSLVFLLESFKFDYFDQRGPGPGFFPVWINGLLMLCSLIYIFQSAKSKEEKQNWPKGEALKNVLVILGSLVLFLLVVRFLGFAVSCFLFLVLLFARSYKWYINLPLAAVVTFVLYWLFSRVLMVPLLKGVWGF